MSVATKTIVQGVVQAVQARSGVTAKKADGSGGDPWSRKTALIFGDSGVVAEVSFRDARAQEACPTKGEFVTMLVEVGSFRDDDTVDFVEYTEVVGKQGAK